MVCLFQMCLAKIVFKMLFLGFVTLKTELELLFANCLGRKQDPEVQRVKAYPLSLYC